MGPLGANGKSDEQPLRLNGIREADFWALMHYLLPLCVYRYFHGRQFHQVNPGNPGRPMTTEHTWIGVLKLATLWNFTRARDSAILSLDSLILSPVTRLRLARNYSIPGWEVPALRKLIYRKAPVNFEDAEALGVKTVLTGALLRKQYGIAVTTIKERREVELVFSTARKLHLAALLSAYDADVAALKTEVETAKERYQNQAAGSSRSVGAFYGSPHFNFANTKPAPRSSEFKTPSKPHTAFNEARADFARKELSQVIAVADAMIRAQFELGSST